MSENGEKRSEYSYNIVELQFRAIVSERYKTAFCRDATVLRRERRIAFGNEECRTLPQGSRTETAADVAVCYTVTADHVERNAAPVTGRPNR